ncbi:hypothetical protein GWN28_04775 [candidate division KSB1 bacterium]|nr:hypothetical protein [Phycisphaerae bacterium]NIU10472.1 hypothetical protein [Phycisphaerae bacterium]NIW17708.1 hypothetical protein [candidate division KSB1 bacterium]NIX30104.1 hypothetical protein [Phycisphaerae bacterium]
MQHINRWMVTILVIAGWQLTACQKQHGADHAEHPAVVEQIPGSEISKVTLTAKAIKRLDVQMDKVREEKVARSISARKVVPYSSLIYDPYGNTWVYTSPEPRTFVRQKVQVDYIEDDIAILKDGPPPGTVVASVAVAELYGTEFEVGH